VPDRIYAEARAVKAKRAAQSVPSIIDAIDHASPITLELAEEPE